MRHWQRLAIGLMMLLGAGQGASAPDDELALVVTLGDLQGPGWLAQGVTLVLESPQAGRAAGRVEIERIALPPPVGTLRRLVARCARLDYSLVQIQCREAQIDPGQDGAGLRSLRGDIAYRIPSKALSFRITAEHRALGAARIEGTLTGSEWSVRVDAEALPLGEAHSLLVAPNAAEDAFSLAGEMDIRVDAKGVGSTFTARFRGTARQLAAGNAQGTIASDGLTASFEGETSSSTPTPDAVDFTLQLAAPSGEAYVEPIYVNLADHPGTLAATGRISPHNAELTDLSFSLADIIEGGNAGRVTLAHDDALGRWRILDLPVTFTPMRLPGAYAVLLQPYLAGTDLDDLDTTGAIRGSARIVNDQLREAHVILEDLYAEDRDGRLAIYGLDGEIDRLGDGRLQPRWLAFDGGFVYGIPFGPQRADFDEREGGPGWRLAVPIDVPVLDGQLHLERLQLTPPPTPSSAPPTIELDASLTAIGMRALSHALEWPPLAGTLSGRIPSVTYENGDIAIAGTLEAEVFSGLIAIDGLRVREPFGNRAIARANIEWRQLDLEELSSTFSFGRMNGRVDGYLTDMVLLNWSPLRFDGALFTSPGDRSRHRISQRAVDNIASLGGASAALSSTFLRFFEDFAYDELRLGCRLQDGVCLMSGLEAVTDDTGLPGYLILRGRGLPRLKVVGHAEHVDWPRFLAQLRSITEPDGEISFDR
ncbi:MAG: hypothetical protein AAGA68_22615 [Pseudomonadota bacterium]